MIHLVNLYLEFGDRVLLKNLSLVLRDKECVAVVGPNGCGKSTLLKVIAGLQKVDRGEVRKPAAMQVGYLPQEGDLDSPRSLRDELREAFRPVLDAQERLRALEGQMADGDAPESVYDAYARLSHFVEMHGAESMESEVGRVARGLGFSVEELERPCCEFSGGWRMRILLGKLLLERPDVLLLDEPTNHLDLETTLWLESWIFGCGQTVVLVSHERATMDRLADRIVCMEQGDAAVYPGDYSHYLQASAEKREALWKAYEQQREEIERIENFIRRFRASANHASLVQSRVKQLEKVDLLEPPFHPTAIHFSFPPAPHSHADVVQLRDLGHRYGDTEVFSGANLLIRRGDRVGLVGRNGAGKSTLLRLMAGQEEPAEGTCALGGKVELAYFAQYESETLASEETVLAAMERTAPKREAHRARNVLGAFLFQGDDVEKPLQALSGGERTRFRLARLLFSPANLLLLDEPTNHLDVTSRATVEEALQHYSGTVVVVSHDRLFMERVTNRVIEIEDGQVREFPGDYGHYFEERERQLEPGGDGALPTGKATRSSEPEKKDAVRQERIQGHAERRALSRKRERLERRIAAIEEALQKSEERMAAIDAEMSDPAVAADFGRLGPLQDERIEIDGENETLLEEWEELEKEMLELDTLLGRALENQ